MDTLVKWGKSPALRKTIKQLGLPVSLPPPLTRRTEPWGPRVVADAPVCVWSRHGSRLLPLLAEALPRSGARVLLAPEVDSGLFEGSAEAWGEPVMVAGEPAPGSRIYGLVVDGTAVSSVADLADIYRFVALWVRAIAPGGRVVLLGNPLDDKMEARVLSRALEGFTRSLAKELGRRGITANLLRSGVGGEAGLLGPLRFLLSGYSCFVTAQPLTVGSCGHARAQTTFSAQPLAGQRALVTGAARGIGLATARALRREGAALVIVEHPASATAASVVARELQAELFLVDLASPEASAGLCGSLAKLGGVDIVVHNAGVTRDRTIARMKPEEWELVLAVNLQAVMLLTTQLREQSLLHKGGRIVLLSSVGGIAGNPGQTNYAASKAGLIGYTEALAQSFAADPDAALTINAIAPGFIETRMTDVMPPFIKQAARRLSALNQGGLPADVAEAVLFLSLPSSGGINGQVLRVCGGALIGA